MPDRASFQSPRLSRVSHNFLLVLIKCAFYSFMSILLPCSDVYLRADVTQRPSKRTLRFENLDPVV